MTEKQQETEGQKWLKGVAITATVLAVMTSIATARFNNCINQTQLLTSEEAMKWQYFQSKNIRLQFIEVQQGLIRTEMATNPDPVQRGTLFGRLKAYNEENFKVDTKKGEIEEEARALGRQKKTLIVQGFNYMLSVVIFQISIMLSSVSALVHRRVLWISGVALGFIALVFFANGFFLFFDTNAVMAMVNPWFVRPPLV